MREAQKNIIPIIENAINCVCHTCDITIQAAGSKGDWCTHPYPVIAHILEGESELFQKDPSTVVLRKPGETVYVPAGIFRRCHVTSSTDSKVLWVRASFTVFSGLDIISFFDYPLKFPNSTKENFSFILQRLLRITRRNSTSILETAIERQQLLHQLLHLIVRHRTLKKGAFQTLSSLQRLEPVLRYIDAYFREDIEVDQLAKLAYLSKSQFHRTFKRTLNISPLEYQKLLRLKEAQQFLLFSDLNVAEIAEKTGYGDPPHFSRIFKAHVGISPQAYRRQNSLSALGM